MYINSTGIILHDVLIVCTGTQYKSIRIYYIRGSCRVAGAVPIAPVEERAARVAADSAMTPQEKKD